MFRIAVKRVSHCPWSRDLWRRDLDLVLADDLCVRPDPFLVGSGDRELVELIAILNSQTSSDIVKSKNDLRTFYLGFLKNRRIYDLSPINILERPPGHPFTDIELIFWMYVACLADIDNHYQAGIRRIQTGPTL